MSEEVLGTVARPLENIMKPLHRIQTSHSQSGETFVFANTFSLSMQCNTIIITHKHKIWSLRNNLEEWSQMKLKGLSFNMQPTHPHQSYLKY